MVSTLVSAVLSPFANTAPTTPVEPPTLWTLLAFARREFEHASSNPSPIVNPLAKQVTNGLVTAAPTLNSQSMAPAIADGTAPPVGVANLTSNAQPSATAEPATYTGAPSLVSQAFTAVFRLLTAVPDFTDSFGVDTLTPILRLRASDSPPWFTTVGLNVQRSEFEGMPVWTLQSPGSTSSETVVAIHGGPYVVQTNIFHWLTYAAMARDTGATVVVPIYPLAPQGTAATVVPAIADLIASQIDQHGTENVSVYGDAGGAGISLAAVQELVRRADPVPSRMVLISPAGDLTLSNPAIQSIDDPVLPSVPVLRERYVLLWAGDLPLTDPLVSPLYGSLAGLPPTAVYSGNLDLFAPDALALQDKALATPGADFTFILRDGEVHDWLINPFLPETVAARPDVYQQLGLISDA
jgi:acetyl esterase/lipase